MCERLVVGGSNKLFDAEPSSRAPAHAPEPRERGAAHTRTVHDGRRKHRGLREEPPLLHHRRVADGGVQQRVRSREGGLHRGGEGPRGQVQGVRLRVLRARGGCGVGGDQEQVVQGGRPRGDHRHRQQEGPGHQGVHRQISPERRRRRRRDRGREGVARGARRPPGRGPSPRRQRQRRAQGGVQAHRTGARRLPRQAQAAQARAQVRARVSSRARRRQGAPDRRARGPEAGGRARGYRPGRRPGRRARVRRRRGGDLPGAQGGGRRRAPPPRRRDEGSAPRDVRFRGGGENGGDEATQHDARRGQAQGAKGQGAARGGGRGGRQRRQPRQGRRGSRRGSERG